MLTALPGELHIFSSRFSETNLGRDLIKFVSLLWPHKTCYYEQRQIQNWCRVYDWWGGCHRNLFSLPDTKPSRASHVRAKHKTCFTVLAKKKYTPTDDY